ncbi:hypothetical protein HYZ78_03520 [Candidatus Microgenomates bacterium]|nr:hypothetical protein [Candidatus Microgenomates bacterium]
MDRLVLIDGNAILHRAYHALPPLTSRDGKVVNAVYGFFGMLFRVVEDLKPTHLAVAFDTEKPTFRHAAYVGYQAHRPRLESDLAEQITLTQELLLSGGIPVFIAPGYEADDIIGTLARQAAEINTNKYQYQILQLVMKHVKVYAPIRGLTETHIFDEKEVKNYMGVTPAQIVDYKALIGDQSDNYPGVAGIGPKTAVGLLEKFKTFEGVYNAIRDTKYAKRISQNVIQKLAEGHESGVLSRDLATIRTDAPVSFDLEKMEFKEFRNNESLVEAFRELGFKSLVARATSAETEKQKNLPAQAGEKTEKPDKQSLTLRDKEQMELL